MAARNSIIIADMDFKVLRINPAMEKVSNIKMEDAVGMDVSEFVPEKYFRQVYESGSDIVGEKINIEKFGFTGLMNIMYMKDERNFMVTIQNITAEEKKRAELEKLRLSTVDVGAERHRQADDGSSGNSVSSWRNNGGDKGGA